MYKMFEMIIDDGQSVIKYYGIYKNVKEASKSVEGNGEVIKIKDVTDKYPLNSSIYLALKKDGFGDMEANAIYSFISRNYSNML